jgi:hypothetical protein
MSLKIIALEFKASVYKKVPLKNTILYFLKYKVFLTNFFAYAPPIYIFLYI